MAKAKTSITTENRSGSAADAAAKEKRTEMPLSDLHPFEGHPFKVLDDELMEQTVESIKQIGVVSPLIVRPDPEGGFEILSGHRRLHAAQLAGLETVPVIVKEMDDDAAIIFMVDSNLQRENILPSERAFSYKMKLEAMKHQGERSDLQPETTSRQLGEKLQTSVAVMSEEMGESQRQIQRFIRLTNLIPEILDMVDTLFQKVAFMFQCVQIIAKCGQVCDLQRNQIDVSGHRAGDLLGCVSILIDVTKDFVAVHQDLRRYDVRFIFRFGFHIVEHELMNRGGFRHIPVKLVMP